MHLYDLMKFLEEEMKYNRKNSEEMENDGFRALASYYRGRYDAYDAILPAVKMEVKRLNLTY